MRAAGFAHWADFPVRLNLWVTAHVDKSLRSILEVGAEVNQPNTYPNYSLTYYLYKKGRKNPLPLKGRTENENSKSCIIGEMWCSLSFL